MSNTRQAGYYWCKSGSEEWEVCRWRGEFWDFGDGEISHSDNGLVINENRIPSPEEGMLSQILSGTEGKVLMGERMLDAIREHPEDSRYVEYDPTEHEKYWLGIDNNPPADIKEYIDFWMSKFPPNNTTQEPSDISELRKKIANPSDIKDFITTYAPPEGTEPAIYGITEQTPLVLSMRIMHHPPKSDDSIYPPKQYTPKEAPMRNEFLQYLFRGGVYNFDEWRRRYYDKDPEA